MSSVSSRPPDRHPLRPDAGPGRRRSTALMADQPSLSEDVADWVDQLASSGLERRVAHRLALVTVVLVALREMPSFLGAATEHIAVALHDLDTYELLQVALVEPELDQAWEALAETTSEPVSGRCRALARLCRRNGLQVVAS